MRVILRAHVFRNELIALAKRLKLELVPADDPQSLEREAPDAQALWTVPSTYDAAVAQTLQKRATKLRWVGLTSVGYDPLVRFGTPKGAIATNVGDALAPVVAEHAVALLLALVRQLPAMHAKQLASTWDPSLIKAAWIARGHDGRGRRLRGHRSTCSRAPPCARSTSA